MTLGELLAAMAEVKQRISTPEVVLRAIGDLMLDSAIMNFEAQGRPKRWVDLKPKTWAWKRKRGYTTMLKNRGQLIGSLTKHVGRGEVSVGSRLKYARIQNEGGVIPASSRRNYVDLRYNPRTGDAKGFAKRKHKNVIRMGAKVGDVFIPARPFLLFQPGELEEYQEILGRYYLTGEIRR